jgi:CDP-4-dehydro-6-deoxyglucose reductase, E1
MKYSLSSDTWNKEEIQAIQDVINDGRYTMGPRVAQFEKEFAEHFDVPYAVMVNSGSTANLLMWSCLGNKDMLNGNVIVPSVSWSTTYFPLIQNKFTPNFVDVDLDTLNLDVSKIEEAITPETVAVFSVNLLGNSCDYSEITRLCKKHNLILIEDNCESLGAISNLSYVEGNNIKVKKCGTVGRMGSFSFFFSHHMQTMEGGMIVCHDKDDYDFIRSLRAHGWCRDLPDDNNLYDKTGDPFKDSFTFITPGYSVRPLEMSGAIGSVQLKKCDKFIEERRNNAKYFVEKFSKLDNVIIQQEIGKSSWFGFSVILKDKLSGKRDEVIKKLTELGVETRPIIAGNFMKQPVIDYFTYIGRGTYDNADYLHDNGFFMGNDVTNLKENIDMVFNALQKIGGEE